MKSKRPLQLCRRKLECIRSISPIGMLVRFILLFPVPAFAGGVVSNCTEADLRTALAGGGTVTFACDGTITLGSTITNTLDTVIDATGHQITISGNNAVRL